MDYREDSTIEMAIQEYLHRYNLGDGGYDDKTFGLSVFGLFAIPIPNTNGRRAAVKLHDIHHVLTNIDANIRGESEIGAWELASGCGKFAAAWVLNLGALSYGMFIWPRRVVRAFMRGCQAKNLYHGVLYDSTLLSQTVRGLRERLGVTSEVEYNVQYLFRYAGFGLLALSPAIAFMAIAFLLYTK